MVFLTWSLTEVFGCIVNCASSGFQLLAEGERVPPDYTSFRRLCIDGRDDSSFDWLPQLTRVVDFIDDCRRCGGCVLVHCLMGLNRSGTVANGA